MAFGDTMTEIRRPFPIHDRHPSESVPLRPVTQRSPVDLPRPVEPRPNAPPSAYPEIMTTPRQADQYRGMPTSPPDTRPQTTTLPRLRELLNSTHPPAAIPIDQRSNWSASTGSAGPVASHGYSFGNSKGHPGHEFSQSDKSHLVQHPNGSRAELPVLETNPGPRHGAPPAHTSPYSAQPDSAREYADPRRERMPLASQTTHPAHPAHLAHHPYPSGKPDERQHPANVMFMERSPPSGAVPPGLETSTMTFIRTEDVPGQGRFYLYEGGIRIPTQVDGEKVNPAWGLTKAMKPRKRLAQACLDCREKKVKCEPGQGNTCQQCEKAKRPCRRAAIHPSQGETGTVSTWSSTTDLPSHQLQSDYASSRTLDADAELSSRRRTRDDRLIADGPNKRSRSDSPPLHQHGEVSSPRVDSVNYHVSPGAPRSPGRSLCAEEDPYGVDPDGTIRLLESFLTNVNDSTYCIFPHLYFVFWVRTTPEKCQEERIVLYAILALGSIFTDGHLAIMGKHCAEVASDAIKGRIGHASMPIAQARLLLAMYYFAQGATSTASDYLGAAANALTLLQYNTEQGCMSADGKEVYEYGFDKARITECRRRTVWTAFLMERYIGSPFCRLDVQDLLIRLPCSDTAFEQGRQISDAPFLHPTYSDDRTAATAAHPMASLIPIVALWGDVNSFVARGQHQNHEHYVHTYERNYIELSERLRHWHTRLPEHLTHSVPNLERSIHGGYAGHYLSMLTLYYAASMKLHRYFKLDWISHLRPPHIPKAHENADLLLQLTRAVYEHCWQPSNGGPAFSMASASPVMGYAILSAVDILGAGGLESSIKTTMDLIEVGVHSLAELAHYWNSAKTQHSACQRRFYQIRNIVAHPTRAKSGCWVGRSWGLDSRIEEDFPLDYDGIYGAKNPDNVYFESLRKVALGNSR